MIFRMLFVSLQTLQFNVIPETLKKWEFGVDGIELRLDLLPRIDKQEISDFCLRSTLPVLFTLRKQSQGGAFAGTETQRLAILEDLLFLQPAFVDFEYDTDPLFIQRIAQKFPHLRIVISYHDFTHTPLDLSAILSQMQSPFAYSYKIATLAHSTCDALRMLLWVREQKNIRLSGICMGNDGQITRILGPVFGNFIDYAPLEEETAPGQLTFSELQSIYHYFSLTSSTGVYGLIGDPVENSLSHWTHNALIRERGWNAVYIKMRVTKEELTPFLSLARACGFSGLSVTMPLKEEILSLLEKIDTDASEIQAVNTLFLAKSLQGYNTDGIGGLDALETKEPVQGKKILVLGAGGAARAIAFEALRRRASVLILNRTFKRAADLARSLGCQAGRWDEFFKQKYDIVINATPHPMPIVADHLIPGTLAMDIKSYPKWTSFLRAAQEKGCSIVFGYEMFVHQAARQFSLWFNTEVSSESFINLFDP